MTPRRFVFVGEKRSARAIAMGVRWVDGRLAARTLTCALAAAGVDVAAQHFLNLYRDGDGWRVNHRGVAHVRNFPAAGLVVVGMGRRVQRALAALEIPHVELTHPAARGLIRRRDRYHEHVRTQIGGVS